MPGKTRTLLRRRAHMHGRAHDIGRTQPRGRPECERRSDVEGAMRESKGGGGCVCHDEEPRQRGAKISAKQWGFSSLPWTASALTAAGVNGERDRRRANAGPAAILRGPWRNGPTSKACGVRSWSRVEGLFSGRYSDGPLSPTRSDSDA